MSTITILTYIAICIWYDVTICILHYCFFNQCTQQHIRDHEPKVKGSSASVACPGQNRSGSNSSISSATAASTGATSAAEAGGGGGGSGATSTAGTGNDDQRWQKFLMMSP